MVDLAKIYTTGENILTSRQNRAMREQDLGLKRQQQQLTREKLQQQQREYTDEQLADNTDFAFKAFAHIASNPNAARVYAQPLVERGVVTEDQVMQFNQLAPEDQARFAAEQRDLMGKALQAYQQATRKSKLLTPEELAQQQSLKPTTTIYTGDIPLTTTQQSKNQQSMINAQNSIEKLKAIGSSYADKFLTYSGQIKGAWTGLKEKAGFKLDKQDKDFLTDFTTFTTEVKRFFNAYRKEITGAAAAVQELEQLKQSVINGDMSPTEFKAAFNSLMNGFNDELTRYYGYATSGIPGPEQQGIPQQEMTQGEIPPGWQLMEDAMGNRAYVGPNGEVREVQ